MILNLLFLVLSVIATAVLYAAAPTVSLWWLLPLLVGFFVGAVLLFFAVLLLLTLFMPTKKPIKQPKRWCSRTIGLVMEWLMPYMGIKISLIGEELIPSEPCILVSNHRSDFDPMTVLAKLRNKRISYISKQSNFKIPIVGSFICHAGFLAIDRGNGVRALRTLKVAEEMLKGNKIDIMGIYPEGTRSKTGELLRFKSGAFLLAKKAEVPIVVMTTKGTENISKRFLFAKKQVELKIVTVIDPGTVHELTREELTERVRSLIEENLK